MGAFLNCKEVSTKIDTDTAQKLEVLETAGVQARLELFQIGDKADESAYASAILRKGEQLGVKAELHRFPEDVSSGEYLAAFRQVNDHGEIDGLLLLQPLPRHIETEAIKREIRPEKDVDGFGYANMAYLYAGDHRAMPPCTAQAVIEVLEHYGVELSGMNAAVVGRSPVVGKPLSLLLLARNATVTMCHSRTRDLSAICRRAGLVVSATGKPRLIGRDHVTEQTILVDVGVSQDDTGALCGDVAVDEVQDVVSRMTKSSLSLGSVTTSVLLRHTALSAWRRAGKE